MALYTYARLYRSNIKLLEKKIKSLITFVHVDRRHRNNDGDAP